MVDFCIVYQSFLSGGGTFPYVRMLYYSVIENQFVRRLAGLQHYVDTMKNQYFQLALGNSLLLIICVPILLRLALIISLVLSYAVGWLGRLRMSLCGMEQRCVWIEICVRWRS